ncbi:MAG TPA: tRNA epoxyqueuosine(34) reductase QueG [Clostridiaceae bacterium]|nr:tRNA epoxyqueuosine(34) reductase QueG [Clostridiaceae bacterium]
MEEIREKLESMGLEAYGFMKVRTIEESRTYFEERERLGFVNPFEEQDMEVKLDLASVFPEGKTIISIAFPYFYNRTVAPGGYFSVYTRGKDYHVVVRRYLEEVAQVLREKGYQAKVFADNNPLPERLIAHIAGVGEIGRNHMVITEKYGSYVFLGEVVTDYEMETVERDYREIPEHRVCGTCTNCVKACPTKILGSEMYNTRRCMSYITQDKNIEDADFALFKGRLFGCDTCQLVCPLNKDAEVSFIEDFRPLDFMQSPDVHALVALDNEAFRRYKETSSGWRGKKLLQRNAMIELVRRGERVEDRYLNTAYLMDYYNRLLSFFKL